MAQWQYEESPGDFRDFEAGLSKEIEAEYVHHKGEGKYDLEAGGQCYSVCFKRFLQVNVETGKVRRLRRVWAAPGWAWKADGGSWESYSPIQAKKIEEEYHKGAHKPFTLRLTPSKQVTIDITKSVQVNESTGTERVIKRTTVYTELPADRIVGPDGKPKFMKRSIEAVAEIPEEDANLPAAVVEAIDNLDETIVQKPEPWWEWKSDDAEKPWVRYDAQTSGQIEKAYKNGEKKAGVKTAKGLELVIDFGKMKQFREETKGARKVRRVGEDEAPPAPPSPPQKKAKKHNGAPSTGKPPHSTEIADNWEANQSALVLPGKVSGSEVVYGFDMDDTLITTKSGKVHPTSASDWKWLHPTVKPMLQKLNQKGIKIVIFSNQAGIGGAKGHASQKAKDIKSKILAISKDLGLSLQAFISAGKDRFRKPNVGMWELMQEQYNDGVKLNMSECMYIGDAAGRSMNTLGGKGKDFSCGDRKFAHNIGVGFATPEEFFLGEKEAPFSWGAGFNPKTHKFPENETEDGVSKHHADKQEVVVMVGFPGSGKSSFAKKHFVQNGYVHVNRDTLKTAAKCINLLKESLAAGKSVVVDNTNPKPETRKEIISIAKAAKVPVRCFYMTTSFDLSRHLNAYREGISNGTHAHVPTIAYNMYKGGFQKPTTKEGFTQVKEVAFVPRFETDKEKKLFHSWLLSE